jgi:hypothetical protein
MTDQPDDPRKRTRKPAADAPADAPGPEGYPPPMFAPAAEPGPEGYPPPTFAPATEAPPTPALPEPAAPAAVSGEIASGATPAPAPAPAEEPLLPATYRENDLRAAIGSPPVPEHIRPRRARDDDDDDGEAAPRGRKTVLVVAGTLFVGVGIAALVILGRLNSARYAVSCGAKEAAAEQGRSFPPWGMSRRGGAEWKPIPIPPSFPCAGLETQDPAVLGDAYRKMLVERAESLLTAKEVTQIDEAAAMLEQALLHARGGSEPHRTARQAIQRMLGDVGYWRASARLQKAVTDLTDAAKQFETAGGQLPRYVSDANAWATHVRRLSEELRAGPSGAKAPASPATGAAAATPAPDRSPAPTGVALPVEPAAGSGSASGAGSAETPPATPDAGIPTGGVLL